MTVPHWVSYVGLVGGVVGTVSGCLAYHRTGQLKALDLRLQLRRIDADIRNLFELLPDQLDLAKRLRERVLAALGSVNSDAMLKWKVEWDKGVAARWAASRIDGSRHRRWSARHPQRTACAVGAAGIRILSRDQVERGAHNR
jgi:hypothetical protein